MVFTDVAISYFVSCFLLMYMGHLGGKRRRLVGMYCGEFWNGWDDDAYSKIRNRILREKFIEDKIIDKQFMAERFGKNAKYRTNYKKIS